MSEAFWDGFRRGYLKATLMLLWPVIAAACLLVALGVLFVAWFAIPFSSVENWKFKVQIKDEE